MPYKCCVPKCKSNYLTEEKEKKEKVSIYRFPPDKEEKNKWIKAIPRANLTVNNNTRVCRYHWPADCTTFIASKIQRCGVVRCGAVRCGTVRYGTVRYGTVRYGTVRYGTVRYGTVRYGTVRYGTVRCGAVRYGTVRYGTVRCGAVRYGTVRYGIITAATTNIKFQILVFSGL